MKLSLCERKEAHNLLAAARLHGNERILLQIENRDMVAIEVRYHNKCYREFTRVVTKGEQSCRAKEGKYSPSFKIFAETVVRTRVIQNHEILRLKTLNVLFHRIVKDTQNEDATNHTTQQLKIKLKKEFPELVFVKPAKRFESEIVYAEDISVDRIVESVAENAQPLSSEASASATSEESDDCGPDTGGEDHTRLRTLYHASQIVRGILRDAASSVRWPPTADDLTPDAARAIVPAPLFNFLSWCVGFSDHAEWSNQVSVTEFENQRIMSLAQDLLYTSRKGCIILPKHSSLAMTVRHMTGSARLIGMLNRFGHCVSHSMVLEHDTALAESQLKKSDDALPEGVQESFTTLVWDNNDFGEETITGRGTTHNTNGILIQRSRSFEPTPDTAQDRSNSMPKSRKRSVDAPKSDVTPYFGVMKRGPTHGYSDVDIKEETHQPAQREAHYLDRTFHLSRLPCGNGLLLPSWTGYNTLLRSNNVPARSNIYYLPVIDASPTENSTIYTILLKSVKIADVLKQATVVVVADQAVYCKLQQIRWQDPLFMQRTVVRLGEFHTCMAFLSCIGKRFSDAGLRDVLIEAGVVAQGSINGVLSGHHYNRSLRAHKMVSEAMEHMRWNAFSQTLPDDEQASAARILRQLQTSFPGTSHTDLHQDRAYIALLEKYASFITCQSAKPTFNFWSSYIAMVQLLLRFIRGTREGNWSLHLSTARSMLPWFFAYDHINYSRYLSVYWIEMQQLPATHPSVHDALSSGEFAVQRQVDHGFSGIAADQTIEQTINRESKMKGGVIGNTTSQSYFHRWALSQHLRAAIQVQCESMSGKQSQSRNVKELDATRILNDNECVRAVCDTLSSMIDPFQESAPNLLHIASGVVASPSVEDHLLGARLIGETATTNFCKERLQDGSVDFHKPLKRNKLQTFTNMAKTTKRKLKGGKEVFLKQDRNFFARLLIISRHRDFDLREVLKHSVNPVPLPLANERGGINKTNKASLMKNLESITEPSPLVAEIPRQSTWVVDGMALIQETNIKMLAGMTFGQFAKYLHKKVLSMATAVFSDELHIVTDRYPVMSIKNAERDRRSSAGAEQVKIYGPDQQIPNQWKKFLASGANKEALIEFIFKTWATFDAHSFQGVTVFLTHGDVCHSFKATSGELQIETVPQLRCTHEEADTRLLLHCLYIANHPSTSIQSNTNIVIRSPDTDVFVIAVGVCEEVGAHLLFHTGRGDLMRTIDIKAVANFLGPEMAGALMGLHCFTGCDSVSSFFGKGKAKAMKLLLTEPTHQQPFQELGQNFSITPRLVHQLESFTCRLYGQDCEDVNLARYNMFRMDCKFETTMPPNRDSLQYHILRANYQAAIHRRALQAVPDVPSPVNHGWKLEDDELRIHWGDLPPAPDDLLAVIQCSCKKSGCKTRQCECLKSSIPCTDLCKCRDCNNKADTDEDILDVSPDDEDSDAE